jgi:DNA-binding GntR family transcriptional regulator
MTRQVWRSTLTEQIENLLSRDVIEGTLQPGSRLIIADLAERYQASATPLREALQRLAARGLIEIDPHLGASVAPMSRDHLIDTYWVRSLLEEHAVRAAVEKGDAAWAANLEAVFANFASAVSRSGAEPGRALEWAAEHRQFHASLIAACGSPWLLRLLDTLNTHTERYRLLSMRAGIRDPVAEHRAIFDAAIARDGDLAAHALVLHLDRTVDIIKQYLP